MIRKLQIKLILASMLSLMTVLTVILGAAGILNYTKIIRDADSILSVLQENDGNFPINDHPKNDAAFTNIPPIDDRRFSVELPYESRYFSVFISADGEIVDANIGKIAAVDTTTAIEYAKTVIQDGKPKGFVKDYRYTIYSVGDEVHVIFLDYGREMGSFRTFLFTGIGVSAIGLLAVLLLFIFLSGRIVKPFSQNYEKQKRFITDAGHELKTPLTIIHADAEVLEMDIGENEWLSDIQLQTKRMSQLTNSLIQLARMEEQPQIEKIEFPISDVVEETVETFQALAKTKDKNLSSKIQPMLSMNGDEKSIRQLVTILMDNAIKYSDDKGIIEITLEKQRNSIQFCVFNTAKYISKEKITHFFDRFYRADQSRNSQIKGYGLGLSIALAIVAAHKGKITATTQDEKSLMITVVFPIG